MADKKISQLTAATTPIAGTEVLPIVQSGATVKATPDDLLNRGSGFTTVQSNNRATNTYGNLHVQSDSNAAAYNGGSLSFGGKSAATGNQYIFGTVKFMTDPTTVSGWDTYGTLSLTNADSSVSEKISWFNNGNLNLNTGNLVVSSGKGIDFSATAGTGTSTSELLADYEEGTFSPTVIGTTTAGTATYANQLGKYTKIGRLVTVEIYVNWNTGTGTGSLTVGNFPFTIGSNVYGSASIWGEISLTALNYLSNRMLAGGTAVDLFNAPVGGGVTNPVAYQASGSLMITATYST